MKNGKAPTREQKKIMKRNELRIHYKEYTK